MQRDLAFRPAKRHANKKREVLSNDRSVPVHIRGGRLLAGRNSHRHKSLLRQPKSVNRSPSSHAAFPRCQLDSSPLIRASLKRFGDIPIGGYGSR
jgi:hypothetical protein